MRIVSGRRTRFGFSMVELIVVGAILIVLTGIFFRFYQQRSSSDSSLTTRLALQIEARRAADAVSNQLRHASEVLRPQLGETLSYVAYLDAVNQPCMLYPTLDAPVSARLKKDVFALMNHISVPGGVSKPPARLTDRVRRVAFTLLAPNSVQMSITVADERDEYQFLTSVGLMNFGANE